MIKSFDKEQIQNHLDSNNELPFINLKWAQTLDGKIATLSNDSKWITNESARAYVHEQRGIYDAILIGTGTLLADNPSLNMRLENRDDLTQPKKVILGDIHKAKADMKIFQEQSEILWGSTTGDKSEIDQVKIWSASKTNLRDFMIKLRSEGIKSIIIEGGSATLTSFWEQGLAHKVTIFIAPKILGLGKAPLNHKNSKMAHAFTFENGNFREIENQIIFESLV